MRDCSRRCVYCGSRLEYARATLDHVHPLAKGGTLFFEMGDQPNKQFGASPKDRPPSFGQPAGIAD